MANLVVVCGDLLRSGKYSDFTLVCGGREFPAHKSIVCLQSPVITTALESGFKEAKTNTIQVDFDPIALKCMLDYLYTADYPQEIVQIAQQAESPAPSKQQAEPSRTRREEKKLADVKFTDTLDYHVGVNRIADYYGVTALAKLSATRIGELFNANWTAKVFCDFIQGTKGSTGDANFRQVLAQTAALHAEELMTQDAFVRGAVADDLAAEVLKEAIKLLNRSREASNRCRAEIQTEKRKTEVLLANMGELTQVLSSTHGCCRRECRQAFGCVIRASDCNGEKRWLIRCAGCGGRHTYDKQRDIITLAPSSSGTARVCNS